MELRDACQAAQPGLGVGARPLGVRRHVTHCPGAHFPFLGAGGLAAAAGLKAPSDNFFFHEGLADDSDEGWFEDEDLGFGARHGGGPLRLGGQGLGRVQAPG